MRTGCRWALILMLAVPSGAAWAGDCRPPADLPDPPPMSPADDLVSHTEEVIVDRPFHVVMDETNAERGQLNEHIKKADNLPGVVGTHELNGPFGPPGSRRLVCLSDDSIAIDRVLENERGQTSARFRYQVYGYTSAKARPIVYGIGLFVHSDLGHGRTKISWTYSFKLNRHRFPGYLGPLGDFLFRVGFLDRDYAQMMRRTLDAKK